MNKQILTFLSIVVAVAIIAVVVLKVGPGKVATSNVKSAQGLENSGEYDKAMSEYASALIAKTEGKTFPNIPDQINAANLKVAHLNPQTWQKPIAEIVDWLNVDKKPSSEVPQLFEALARCEQKVNYKNYIFEIKMNKVSLDQYKMIWRQLFCPESSLQTGLIEKAFSQSVVIMTLTGNTIYSYEADFVNRASGQRINVPVELDKAPPFLIKPGSYFLVFKSKAMFQHGFQTEKGWTSSTEAVSFTVPDSVNVITAMLRTEVERKKEKSSGGDLIK
jgi:hypothetical protein